MTQWERLFDLTEAFDHPVTRCVVPAILIGLFVTSLMIRFARYRNLVSGKTFSELNARTRSWYVLAAAMIVPILLGAAWVFGFFLLLSLFCFREYARVTGVDSSRTTTVSVALAILLTYAAILDHWMGLFTASWALGICGIAVISLLPDDPDGYIRRVALAIVGFALFGISLGHLAYLSNDEMFRPILLWLLFCTEANDVFAYVGGKAVGKRKLLPNTSPNKTWGGAISAICLTTPLVAFIGHFVFLDTALDSWPHLVALGVLISVLGQCGDLVISSFKRDLGIKDTSAAIPGHGGLLDRFDSLLIVAPVVFHYVNYFGTHGIGHGQPVRIFTASCAEMGRVMGGG